MLRKLISTIAIVSVFSLAGCKDDVHWSHKECVNKIVTENNITDYTYSAREISKTVENDDTIYCFEITIHSTVSTKYCCFVVMDGDEIHTIDCDIWPEV